MDKNQALFSDLVGSSPAIGKNPETIENDVEIKRLKEALGKANALNIFIADKLRKERKKNEKLRKTIKTLQIQKGLKLDKENYADPIEQDRWSDGWHEERDQL